MGTKQRFADAPGLYPGQSYIEAWELFLRWNVGIIGPSHYYFSPNSVWARNMMNAPGVSYARTWFYNQNRWNLASARPLADYPYVAQFGFSELTQAGLDPIEHFIGGYNVTVSQVDNCTIQFQIQNVTSYTSYTRYIFGMILPWELPSWERSTLPFGGNMYQTITWTERIRG